MLPDFVGRGQRQTCELSSNTFRVHVLMRDWVDWVDWVDSLHSLCASFSLSFYTPSPDHPSFSWFASTTREIRWGWKVKFQRSAQHLMASWSIALACRGTTCNQSCQSWVISQKSSRCCLRLPVSFVSLLVFTWNEPTPKCCPKLKRLRLWQLFGQLHRALRCRRQSGQSPETLQKIGWKICRPLKDCLQSSHPW